MSERLAKFLPGDKVEIVELKLPAVVLGYYVGEGGVVKYLLRYFNRGEAKEIYFYDWEIVKK